ncbi:LOW QUALITY PROTEIN: Fc receptor-like protein 6 [Neophocaena asiaeorientalis asiaeorientalis]|uniref:LOW QUALITY PROTEIN: Fc receptor-like protein 6 n=1 Tax=Neophocaena asiaeorientalis asiaeorientalis TaxID=1706337 RepID=A0A341BV93_NEOAA|nr:LOW QUALITY PROTEIN: Fc receptor-like protein 6 [Neophocaena asiaeorientalis asiaeorientalis]
MLLWTVALPFVPCVGKTAWLSLQVQPDPVFEGDILTLRCWGRRNAALSQVKFYRDGKFLHLSKDNQPLSTGTATVNSSGRYSCTGQVTYMQYVGRQTSRTVMVQVQELFLPPVLRAHPSRELRGGSLSPLPCEGSQRSAWQLLFSLHKEGHTLQDRSLHPELCIPAAEEGDSGLYWCKAALEGGWVQKQSPQLEVRVRGGQGDPPQGPGHLGGPADPSKLCGAPPLRSSFYLNGDTLRNHVAPHGGAISFLFPVMSEQDAGDYTCEAENSVSKETSKAETLSVDGPWVLSAPTSINWLVPWLPANLLGMVVIAAALLGYFRPRRKTGPLPPQNLPPATGGEEHLLYVNVHCQNENDEGVIYSVVRTIPKESER